VGESKRRREAVLNGPCPCGAAKPAHLCCFNGRNWYKPAAILGLKSLPPALRVEKCYMKELGSCVAPISGEHLISEAVIRVLMAEGDFLISGLPWLEEGEEKLLPPHKFKANCLCVKHNSALHPLDDAAKYFFASLKSCLELDARSTHAIVSGHDIERWLLKTAKALAVSKNFAKGRERLSGAFASDGAVLDMLDNPGRWPAGAGLYCVMNTGELTENHPRFQLQPFTNHQGEIEILAINILGLRFVLMLEPTDIGKYPFLRDAKYRPGRIEISYPSSTNWVTMSWADGKAYHETLMVKFVQQVQRRAPKRHSRQRPYHP
jgi:hypothetical protein